MIDTHKMIDKITEKCKSLSLTKIGRQRKLIVEVYYSLDDILEVLRDFYIIEKPRWATPIKTKKKSTKNQSQ